MDTDEIIINAVREYENLWKTNCKSYKDHCQASNSWNSIVDTVGRLGVAGMTSEKIKQRWKYLRDTYRKRKAEYALKKSGSASESTKKWKHFKSLTFLDNVLEKRCTITNAISPTGLNELEDANDENENNDEDNDSKLEEKVNTGMPKFVKNKKKEDLLEQSVMASLDMWKKSIASNNNRDENDAFGESVAGTLKRLTPLARADAKVKIQQILLNAEFGMQNNTTEATKQQQPSFSGDYHVNNYTNDFSLFEL